MVSVRVLVLLAVAVLLSGCGASNLARPVSADTTPPAVVATLPANGAENVTEARVVVTFSEPMSTATVRLDATPSVNWGTPTWSDGDRTVTFVPSDLRPNTRYTVRVTGRDRAGNNLPANVSFTFTTGALVQAGVVAESLVQNRVFSAADERLYAVFMAWAAAQPDRAAQALSDEQRRIREVAAQRAPEATRRAREFFDQNALSPARLAEAAFWLTPDLRAGREPTPVTVTLPQPEGPAPAPTPRQTAPRGSEEGPRAPVPSPSATPSGTSPDQPGPTPSAGGQAASPEPRSAAPAAPAPQQTPSNGAAQPAPPEATAGPGQQSRGNGGLLPPGLADVVREVYEKARGRELWAAAQAEHGQLARQYRLAVEEPVRQATTYLRLSTWPFQRLVVVPNLLGPRDQVEPVSVAGTLHVVVGPSSAPNVRGVVRAFLRAVLQPVTAAARDEVDRLSGLYDLVRDEAASRGLREWEPVVRESLVRAVEARLFLPAREERESFLDSSFHEGLILVRHFAGRLDSLERGEVNLQQFVQRALQTANADQLRQQWQGRSRR